MSHMLLNFNFININFQVQSRDKPMKPKFIIYSFFVFQLTFLFSQPYKSDFKISQDNQPSTIFQFNPRMFVKDSDHFILTWTDYRKGTDEVYAQLYDGNGNKIENNFLIKGNYDLIFVNDSTFISIHDSRSYFDLWYINVSFYGNVFVNQQFKQSLFLGNLIIPSEGVVSWFNSISSFIYHKNRIIAFLLDGGIAKKVVTQLSDGSTVSEQIYTPGVVEDVQSEKLSTNHYAFFWLDDSLRIGYPDALYGNFYNENDSLLTTKKLLSFDQSPQIILKTKVIDTLYYIFLLKNNSRTLITLRVDKNGNQVGNIDSTLLGNPYGVSSNNFSDLNFSNLKNNLFYLFTNEFDYNNNRYVVVNYLLEFNKEGVFTGNLWLDTSSRALSFEKQFFNTGNGNFFVGLNEEGDVFRAKLNLFNLLNYEKANDDLVGSNEYVALMAIKNANQNFIFYKDEVGWKGRFVSNNGDILSEEKRINVDNVQFFSNGNAISLWQKLIDDQKGICGFYYYDDNLNLIRVDTLKDDGDNLYIYRDLISFRVIDNSKILIVYRKGNSNFARLQNIDGTLIKDIFLGGADYSVPKIFKHDDSTYVINWSNQIGVFDANLNAKSPIYQGNITLYFGNYLYLYIYSTYSGYPPIKKYYGVIKNISGDQLNSIYFGEFYYGFNVHPVNQEYFIISYAGYDSLFKNFYVKSYTTSGSLSRGPIRINQNILANRNNLTSYVNGDKIFFLWSDNRDGNFDIYASIFEKGVITSIDENFSPAEKLDFNLYQNYPNPFNSTSIIKFSIKEEALVTIKLYDMLGREIATLVNEMKTPGEYSYELDGGKLGLSSGVYLYQMKAGGYNSIKKLIYLK